MRVPDSTVFLTQAAKALGIPSLVTEQYPKAFGQTVPEIRKVLPATTKVCTNNIDNTNTNDTSV